MENKTAKERSRQNSIIDVIYSGRVKLIEILTQIGPSDAENVKSYFYVNKKEIAI
jgi:hypothetical protein